MKKYSSVYKREGKCFRYDFERCVVERVAKAGPEELADNAEWMAERGKPLWDIDEDGYMVLDAVGLRPENWKRKGVRDEYLDGWIAEMAVEFECEMEMFVKYELPHYI